MHGAALIRRRQFLRAGLGQLALVATSPWIGACSRDPLYRQQGYVFGTQVELAIWGEPEDRARQAVTTVLAEFDRLNGEFHAWKPSALTRLNTAFAQGDKAVAISAEMAAVLKDAAAWSARSDQLFNPAIGGLVALWGFHGETFSPRLPDPAAVAKWLAAHPVMADIQVEGLTARSANPAVQLDLGGYAKGYALDRARALLRGLGIGSALVNIGGNITALGERGYRPWRVGVQHPRSPSPIITAELYDGESIGTSGDYQRFFELAGRRYCHIIDPRTGQPAQDVQSVTVIVPGNQGALSDLASKPLFVAGPSHWREAAAKLGVVLAMLVDGHGGVHVTPLLGKRATFIDKTTQARDQD